jgi:hypothetical protein
VVDGEEIVERIRQIGVREALRRVRRNVALMHQGKNPKLAALLRRIDKMRKDLERPLVPVRKRRKKR